MTSRFLRSILTLVVATPLVAQVPAPRPVPAAPAPPAAPPVTWVSPAPLAELMPAPLEALRAYELDLAHLADLDTRFFTPHAFDEVIALADGFGTSYAFSDPGVTWAREAGSWSLFDSQGAPAAWAPQDPADSLYRVAREHLNRGDYRRAATLFGDIGRRHPNSDYVSAAMYYQAFALYRIGGTPELQEALAVLDAHRAKFPVDAQPRAPRAYALGASSVNVVTTTGRGQTRADADALAARIASVLSSRGLADNAAVRRALQASGNACDTEDQSVRASALSALMQSDPEGARQLASRILTRKDECSIPLRRSALMLVGQRQDDASHATLAQVAKNDPSIDVRVEAVSWIARGSGDRVVATLEELTGASHDERVQRAAMRALAMHSSPRARAAARGIVERNDAPEAMRIAALDGFSGDKATADDAAWMRGVYPRITSPRVRERIVAAVARQGGEANHQWLLALSRDENEPVATRTAALRRIATTMDIASLNRVYDGASERNVRETLLAALASRSEPEAVDKLIDVARNGTDPSMRRMAISALARSKDPRAAKLLLELVDR